MRSLIFVLLALVPLSAAAVEYPQADANGFISPSDGYYIIDTGDGDTCRSGYTCEDLNARSCNQTTTTAEGTWSEIEGLAAGQIGCIEEGDHTGKGDDIDITTNATSGNEIIVIGVHSGDWDLHTHPALQTTKVHTEELVLTGDWNVIQGLYVNGGGITHQINYQTTGDNNRLHNIEVDCDDTDTGGGCVRTQSGPTGHIYMGVYIYDCFTAINGDRNGLSVQGGDIRFFNSIVADCTDNILDLCNDNDCEFLNLDLYQSGAHHIPCDATDLSAIGTGNCDASENAAADIKRGNSGAPTNRKLYSRLRVRDWRHGVGDLGASGGTSGCAFTIHSDNNGNSTDVTIRYSIFRNGQAAICLNTSKATDNHAQLRIMGNVFDGLDDYADDDTEVQAFTLKANQGTQGALYAFNTHINIGDDPAVEVMNWATNNSPTMLTQCNVILNSAIRFGGTTPSAGSSANGRWAYDTASTVYDTPSDDGGHNISTLTATEFTDYTYYEWDVSGTATLVTITDVLPLDTIPTAMKTCGADFAGFGGF